MTDLYPSCISEWELAQSLAGILDVIHSDVGKLQYRGRSPKELADCSIYFYESLYTPGFGKLEAIPLPSFQSDEWPTPDTIVSESLRCKLLIDIRNAMKINIGSKIVHLSWFISLHIFVDFFSCKVFVGHQLYLFARIYQMRLCQISWIKAGIVKQIMT
ncbi:hypothetical protein O6H91_02G063400 [Diphasiastrum complanatum]|uniref:Uncharacterized protein n=1 Tax=Diphasiastrum complanatum TaxID=34168 RepID=A0ACC2EG23_DIPCM|nr:hypothetical protein O6H91_02G063400 [Diphasiastrum complanatum]